MDSIVIFLLGYILGTHIVFLAFTKLMSKTTHKKASYSKR
jgi:hypothetical protein